DTYGVLWEPGSVTYYYDGNEVGQTTSGITSSPMFMILNHGVSDTIGGPTSVPSDMLVDYVHVYSHDPHAVAVAPQANYDGPGSVAGGPTDPTPAGDPVPPPVENPQPPVGDPPPTAGDTPPPVGDTSGHLLTGDLGGNVLTGSSGDDTLDGSHGADTLVGGAGNDLYIVASAFDVVKETGSGIDTVNSSVSF